MTSNMSFEKDAAFRSAIQSLIRKPGSMLKRSPTRTAVPNAPRPRPGIHNLLKTLSPSMSTPR